MKVSALLLRLMWRPRLSPHVKLGPEDRLGIEIADQCRLWAMEGRLSAVFFHVPNEGGGANRRKAEIELAVKRALGMIPGTPDLVFIGAGSMVHDGHGQANVYSRVLFMELKSQKGVQTANQKDFEEWSRSLAIPYHIVRSLEQAEALLIDHGLLKPTKRGSHG